MEIQIILSVLLFSFGALTAPSATYWIPPTLNATKDGTISPLLKLVGSADGKFFFADSSYGMTWWQASSYCGSFGMKLASITSYNQWSALVAGYNSAEFRDGYWTSGRDSQEITQFKWDGTNLDISEGYLSFKTLHAFPYLTCLALNSIDNSGTHLYYRQCSTAIGALCEI